MNFETILSFLIAAMALTILPGPDLLFVLTESITKGSKNGIAIATGLSVGCLVHTIAAATGISLFIQASPLAFSIIKYAGAAYLFYLAYLASQEEQIPLDFNSSSPKQKFEFFQLFKTGLFMNVLNPKVSIFFIAFLPQFTTPNGIHITLQMIVLGFLFMIQAIILFSTVALLAGQVRALIQSDRFWIITKWTKVLVLLVLGIALYFTKSN